MKVVRNKQGRIQRLNLTVAFLPKLTCVAASYALARGLVGIF
jgi:hypothetical protein